jgi:pseudouridine synthase
VPRQRLNKLIAHSGLASRRAAEELIRQGQVTVNGRVAGLGDKADLERDAIRVRGRALPPPARPIYLLLNKPGGCVTTRLDEAGRNTVFDLIPARLRRGLHAVGRLDYHTEGLLLLTTDGEFANRVAHPRYGCRKTYQVKVKGKPDEASLSRLRRGMVLDGRRMAGAKVTPLRVRGPRESKKGSWWKVELSEGRTRQIREMFFRLGYPVQRLRRVAIGQLSDSTLPRGRYRELSESEVAALKSAPPRGRSR